MKSPFPGMDPYIEACDYWGDFHEKLIGEIERDLSARVPDRYVVRLAKRTYIELTNPADEGRLAVPDIGVVRRQSGRRKGRKEGRRGEGGLTVLEPPVTMRALVETEFQEAYVEVYEVGQPTRLVTAIEVLSPVNKRPETVGWRQYVRKRQVMLGGAANFIEIDLLRGGDRMPMWDHWPDGPYYLLAFRKSEERKCLVWPAFSIRPLPAIKIPLLPSDQDLDFRIQPLVDAIVARSRYDIDYRLPLTPPLSPEEMELAVPRSKQSKRTARN